jgi:hydrogenase maturation protein HypF
LEEYISSTRLRISGIVQGVGFRPYVYTLAHKCALNGYVLNDAEGVTVVIEGSEAARTLFLSRFLSELPPLARVDTMQTSEIEPQGFESFEIRESREGVAKSATVSADMAVCENCLNEMHDPDDRRYGYWLINCTDCGPRYSITKTVPYDRPHTSMADFEMCDACRNEYEDPTNRRYHAQPISCYKCRPKSYFIENGQTCEGEEAIQGTIEALKAGKVIAVKGLGGFHLMCDATNESSVRLLRERKRRPAKPFAVMFASMAAIESEAELSPAEAGQIDSKEKPVVLVRSKANTIAPSVAPGIDRLGVFLPYTPLHHRIFEHIDFPLVATSANLSDEPIIRSSNELYEKLSGVVDGVLTHERDIVNACDDSVIQVLDEHPLMLRMARGFAPYTISLPFKIEKKILAVGANQKNSIALAFDDKIILSPHIGDLGSLEAFEYFERTLETFKGFYNFEADIIVCDKHPNYETAKWARQQDKELIEVQHHYAHILADIAEYGIEEKVLGFAFDGTGYGDDKTIWGGEVFFGDAVSYERTFSLKPFRLLGGEKAVREPRRVALGLLFECFTLDEVVALDIPTVKAFSENEIRVLHTAWQKGLNAPVCSSMGRLFDGVASLAGICQNVSYEGESGLMLEAAVESSNAEPFAYKLENGQIDWSLMVREIIKEQLECSEVASRFTATLAALMTEIATASEHKVILSGGVFQNKTLLEAVTKRFDKAGVSYYLPSKFPVNDGCIALGQLWYALKELKG